MRSVWIYLYIANIKPNLTILRTQTGGPGNLPATEEGPIVIVSTSSEDEAVNVEEDNRSQDQGRLMID